MSEWMSPKEAEATQNSMVLGHIAIEMAGILHAGGSLADVAEHFDTSPDFVEKVTNSVYGGAGKMLIPADMYQLCEENPGLFQHIFATGLIMSRAYGLRSVNDPFFCALKE